MKTLDYTKKTGRIKPFVLQKEIPTLVKLPDSKPSKRDIKSSKSKKAMAVLIDVEKNHNTSWYTELRKRAEVNMDAVALFYRGRKISFRRLFEKADAMAKSLKKMGIEKGDEIPCCISNTPELIYTMLAANKIGAKLNLFGTHLDKEYMKSVLDNTTKKVLIASDDNYSKILDVVNKCGFENKLLISLSDSLPKNPEKCKEYVKDLDKYYHYPNLVPNFKKNDSSIMSFNEFINYGRDYNKEIVDTGTLNTDFVITYTSGSTRKGFPKQIIHTNRSFIVSGTFNDMELSGSPKIPYQRGMCYIHSDSNTNLVTCISDSLMKLWSVSCEPEYGKEVALDVVRINSPSMIEMTTSHLVQLCKDYFKALDVGVKYKFPKLIATFAVGEPTSKGEEKFINKVLRTSKAGSEVRVKGITLPFAPLSVGGGDCEHGGIFYNVFNSVQAAKNMILTRRKSEDNGMAPVVFGNVTALKKDSRGNYVECDYNECGILVANSATNMSGYKNDLNNTLKKIVTDSYGRDWVSCDAYGYIDTLGNVHQKDRVGTEMLLSNGNMILPSQISDVVLKDSKNILSCVVTCVHTVNGDIPVINYELSPFKINSRTKTLTSMHERIKQKLAPILGDSDILFREFRNEKSFPLNGSGKRDVVAIQNMGLKNTFMLCNGNILKISFNQDACHVIERDRVREYKNEKLKKKVV